MRLGAKIAEVKITPPPAKRAAIILGTGVLCGCIMAIHQMHKEFDNVARQINNPLGEVARVEYSKYVFFCNFILIHINCQSFTR